ncbi:MULTISPECIES: hypothetical protein [unclassified Streptomyces]|uniref:hypothetical protein n=1 Tax=unclassified Streptomyces TaxID=2593676 RepID=UPI00344EE924
MEAELMTLAAAGATTLVQQMATEGWGAVRRRMAALLARHRGGPEEAEVEGELDRAREDVIAALDEGDEDVAQGVSVVWRTRLRRLLADDPEAAAELRALLDEVAPPQHQGAVRDINNTINGGVSNAPVIQVGLVSGGIHQGPQPGGRYSR